MGRTGMTPIDRILSNKAICRDAIHGVREHKFEKNGRRVRRPYTCILLETGYHLENYVYKCVTGAYGCSVERPYTSSFQWLREQANGCF